MVGIASEPVFDPNDLLLAEPPPFGEVVTIASGQNLAAGAVLGQITASSKYILALAAAADGSQTPVAVLVEACNASAADKQAFVVYIAGLRQSKLVWGAGITAAVYRRTMAQRGLVVVADQPA